METDHSLLRAKEYLKVLRHLDYDLSEADSDDSDNEEDNNASDIPQVLAVLVHVIKVDIAHVMRAQKKRKAKCAAGKRVFGAMRREILNLSRFAD